MADGQMADGRFEFPFFGFVFVFSFLLVPGTDETDISISFEQIFGKNDTHVPPEGRDLIRKNLHEKGVLFSFYEVAWAQRELFSIFHLSSFISPETGRSPVSPVLLVLFWTVADFCRCFYP